MSKINYFKILLLSEITTENRITYVGLWAMEDSYLPLARQGGLKIVIHFSTLFHNCFNSLIKDFNIVLRRVQGGLN
jgi:hypothetical protein